MGIIKCGTVLRRYCNSSSVLRHMRCYSSEVRVRFAPSPTGQLHLGGLRTALYNYLYARAHGGKFILRIEDTDQERFVPGAMEKLIDVLEWSGICIDEGPQHGGDYGPYIQSERKEIYSTYADKLVESGAAYPCFCTQKRLELVRKACASSGEVYRYDNRCRHLTTEQREEKMASSPNYNIRFKLEAYDKPWQDLVYGPIVTDIAKIEGDPVIMKSDGFPTYHLANVVDDHLMKITHVLRGFEWQVSTTKHVLLYQAFGWSPPHFAHLPLLLKDGKKLSKRNNDCHVDYFREQGYFPETVLGFLTAQGSGFGGADTSEMTLQQMIQQFDLSTLKTSSANLDYHILDRLNREHLRRKMADETSRSQVLAQLRALVVEKFPQCSSENSDLVSDSRLEKLITWALDRIVLLADLVGPKFHFCWILPSSSSFTKYKHGEVVTRDILRLVQEMPDTEFTESSVSAMFKAYAAGRAREQDREGGGSIDYKDIMKLMRLVLCGLKEGPSIAEMCMVLGKATVEQRLSVALQHYKDNRQSESQQAKS